MILRYICILLLVAGLAGCDFAPRASAPVNEAGSSQIIEANYQALTNGYRVEHRHTRLYFPPAAVLALNENGTVLSVAGKNYASIIELDPTDIVQRIDEGHAVSIARARISRLHVQDVCPPMAESSRRAPRVQAGCPDGESCGSDSWCGACWDCNGMPWNDGGDVFCWQDTCGSDGSSGYGIAIIRFQDPNVNCRYDFADGTFQCMLGSNSWGSIDNPKDVSGAYIYGPIRNNTAFGMRLACGNTGAASIAFAAGQTPDQSVVNLGVDPYVGPNQPTTWEMATPYKYGTAMMVYFHAFAYPLKRNAMCEGSN